VAISDGVVERGADALEDRTEGLRPLQVAQAGVLGELTFTTTNAAEGPRARAERA
jgi:hypothetical protein